MTTLVETETDFSTVLKDLVELEYHAIEAYGTAIARLKSEFRQDHKNHIKAVSDLLGKHKEEAPTGPSLAQQWLAKGKVVL